MRPRRKPLSGVCAFHWGERWSETEPYRGRGGLKVARYYLAEAPAGAEVDLPVNPELGRPEHHEFRWLPRRQAEKLLPPRLKRSWRGPTG